MEIGKCLNRNVCETCSDEHCPYRGMKTMKHRCPKNNYVVGIDFGTDTTAVFEKTADGFILQDFASPRERLERFTIAAHKQLLDREIARVENCEFDDNAASRKEKVVSSFSSPRNYDLVGDEHGIRLVWRSDAKYTEFIKRQKKERLPASVLHKGNWEVEDLPVLRDGWEKEVVRPGLDSYTSTKFEATVYKHGKEERGWFVIDKNNYSVGNCATIEEAMRWAEWLPDCDRLVYRSKRNKAFCIRLILDTSQYILGTETNVRYDTIEQAMKAADKYLLSAIPIGYVEQINEDGTVIFRTGTKLLETPAGEKAPDGVVHPDEYWQKKLLDAGWLKSIPTGIYKKHDKMGIELATIIDFEYFENTPGHYKEFNTFAEVAQHALDKDIKK